MCNCQPNNNSVPQPMTISKVVHGVVGISKVIARVGLADNGTIIARRNICKNCIHNVKNTMGIATCNVCSCIVGAKTQVKSEKCPENKW